MTANVFQLQRKCRTEKGQKPKGCGVSEKTCRSRSVQGNRDHLRRARIAQAALLMRARHRYRVPPSLPYLPRTPSTPCRPPRASRALRCHRWMMPKFDPSECAVSDERIQQRPFGLCLGYISSLRTLPPRSVLPRPTPRRSATPAPAMFRKRRRPTARPLVGGGVMDDR